MAKFSDADLAETNDRLKREALQFLNELNMGATVSDPNDGGESIANATREATHDVSLEDVKHVRNSSDAPSIQSDFYRSEGETSTTYDELPETAFGRNTSDFGDDDSLVAMAQRLDDASVISYSSFDVRHEAGEEQPVLSLPCSTGNTGIRAKKKFPKEKRYGPEDTAANSMPGLKPKTATDARRQRHNNTKQEEHDNIIDSANVSSSENINKYASSKTKAKKSRSVSRDRKKDTAEINERDAKWKSSSFYETKPMPPRRKTVQETPTEMKTKDGRKSVSKVAPSPIKKNDANTTQTLPETRRSRKVSKLNDSECTVQTDNKKEKSKRLGGKKLKPRPRGRPSKCESDDESMHGVGCNVRIHDKSGDSKSRQKHMHRSSSGVRSYSKTKSKKDEATTAARQRSTSVPRTAETMKSNAAVAVSADKSRENKSQGRHRHGSSSGVLFNSKPGSRKTEATTSAACQRSNSVPRNTETVEPDTADDDNSVYDSDCDTQVFYESTDDEWSSDEEELPMVGTSVLKAVEDLNNKSIGSKMKNMFGMKG